MLTSNDTLPLPGEDPLERLVAECLARLSSGGEDPIEDVCAANPAHAPELRRRREGLRALGLWSPTPAARPGRVGPFTFLRELGRGGMGVVYLADQHEPLRRLAAVKVIGGHASANAVARFHLERQALASLVHPHIAQVLEAGATDDGQPWYAMEFVDGRPLTHYCDEHRLDVPARLELFLQLCDAVQFAHQRGVLHRDLKPNNILVCERGGRPLVKVIDFGLAKALQDDLVERVDLTEQGQILGTPEYMSPEQAMPTAAGVDTRTDVYSLGSVLYELCAGVLPFDFVALRQAGFHALQQAVCHRDAPPPSASVRQLGDRARELAADRATTVASLVRVLTGDLDWIMSKALQKDREQRYATVSELAADIRRHQRSEPVHAGAPTTLYQLRKFVRRHRTGVVFSAVFLLGLLVALAVVVDLLLQRNESLGRFDTLQVSIDSDLLEQRIDTDLWPAYPDRLQVFDEWLRDAKHVVERLPSMRAQLAALERSGEKRGEQWQFAAPRDAYLHRQLQPLIERIEAFAAAGGALARVERRRAWAAGLQQLTIDDHAAAWRQAIATIADPGACPDYHGLSIEPQLGFVPLGRDEQSKLYEFAFPQPGEHLPERGPHGWIVDKDTCMVFVLIPGGDARLGLDWPDERLPAELTANPPAETEYVPSKDGKPGGRSFVVRLDAFLLSKYEMCQAQWKRTMGTNPSFWTPERNAKECVDLTHPVGGVSGATAYELIRRLRLRSPTSAQWQYAARARAEAPWWTGFSIDGWHGAENLADLSLFENGGHKLEFGECDQGFDDHYPLTAPVDSLRGNAFGLHHMLGNVRELSRDPASSYAHARPADGDGAMEPRVPGEVLDYSTRDLLGGSCITGWLFARSTIRVAQGATSGARSIGLRPACALRKN
ncbi:MAG TPA: bifunctional serine/threonine-protein kinase/formylglycine-generating enzyme family protein [Planctomycetota bacterium]|nr:bifunctional serine/threonine-protein kinase/formylglycine-generating enzyme family protein [Planctomycetota bacterium]